MPNSAAEHLNGIIKAYLRSSRRKQLQNSFSQLSQLSPPTVVNQPSNGCEKNPSEDTVSGGAWRGNKEALFIAPCDELIIRSRLSTRSLLMTLSLSKWIERAFRLKRAPGSLLLMVMTATQPPFFFFLPMPVYQDPKKEKKHEPFASSLLGVTDFFSFWEENSSLASWICES